MSETAVAREDVPRRSEQFATKLTSGRISVVVSHTDPHPPSMGVQVEGAATDTTLALEKEDNVVAPEPAIREQLARILRSSIFVRSERLIGGNQNCLKEYVIGSEVYDRKPPYHPSQDSIVRTEARRLRGKLMEYYETEGKDDPVYVYLRPGSYIPVFKTKEAPISVQGDADSNDPFSSAKASTIAIAILPFHDISGSPLSSMYARGIPDELAYALMQTEGCKVISPASMAHFSAQEHDVAAAMSKVGAQIAFEGSVREESSTPPDFSCGRSDSMPKAVQSRSSQSKNR